MHFHQFRGMLKCYQQKVYSFTVILYKVYNLDINY